jgi:hypothetical protein
MKKFLVLYSSSMSAREQMKVPPEQAKKGMEAWMSWMKKAEKAIVDGGSPLAPVGAAPGKLGGYSIYQAESEQALEQLLKDHPHRMSPNATIEVYEFLKMPGM